MRTVTQGSVLEILNVRSLVAGLLLAVLLANLSQFHQIEARTVANWKAFHRWQVDQLQERPAVRRRYGMFLAIAQVTDGATVLFSANKDTRRLFTPQFRQWLHGIGRVAVSVQLEEEPGFLLDQTVMEDYLVAEGEFSGTPFRMYARQGAEDLLLAMSPEGELMIVEIELVSGP